MTDQYAEEKRWVFSFDTFAKCSTQRHWTFHGRYGADEVSGRVR